MARGWSRQLGRCFLTLLVLSIVSALFQWRALTGATSRLTDDSGLPVSYCRYRARKNREPYSAHYKQRHQRIDLGGPVLAHYSWKGAIQKVDFEQGLATGRGSWTAKILQNQLYESSKWDNTTFSEVVKYASETVRHFVVSAILYDSLRREALILQLLFVLYLYDIPDVEVTFFLEDEAPCGLPLVYYSIHDSCEGHGGFTMPSFDAFRNSFGSSQHIDYATCLDERYPPESRLSKAVWRGTTTGAKILSKSTYSKFKRLELAALGLKNPDILDVGITKYVQLAEGDAAVLEILNEKAPLQSFLPMDDFNRYSVVLDLDGNAWSDRFPALLPFNTPLLKQRSPWKEYFAALAEPFSLTIPFDYDLTDLIPKVRKTLQQSRELEGSDLLQRQIVVRRAFAAEHLSQLGILRAMAYTLTVYSRKQSWTVTLSRHDLRVEVPVSPMAEKLNFPPQFVQTVLKAAKRDSKSRSSQ